MTENRNSELHIAELTAGALLIMRVLFAPDWLGMMNILTLGTGILLLAGRIDGKVFSTLLAGSLLLIAIDVFMGLFAEFAADDTAVLLIIRTLLLIAYLVAFFLRYYRGQISEKLLIYTAWVSTGAEILLSIAGGSLDMMSGSNMGSFLVKTGAAFAVLCAAAAIWGLMAGTGAKETVSSYYKLFLQTADTARGYDLYYIGPNMNWNLYGGILGCLIGIYMCFFGRKYKNS